MPSSFQTGFFNCLLLCWKNYALKKLDDLDSINVEKWVGRVTDNNFVKSKSGSRLTGISTPLFLECI